MKNLNPQLNSASQNRLIQKVSRRFFLILFISLSIIAFIPLFAAFEAHVVNVTAKIENALQVPLEAIDFGTVFPQEELDKPLRVMLSESFLAEDRVDDVEYFIRQKPKCGVTTENGTVLVGPTGTGEVVVTGSDSYEIDCGPPPRPLEGGEIWSLLPDLCQYLSKHPDQSPEPGNDESLNSFHKPFVVSGGNILWTDTHGELRKSIFDVVDEWLIDLAVPCFGGNCAQDWEDFVHGHNPAADPQQYVQPLENEHKIFGCNLWVEVSGVSETQPSPPPPPQPPPPPPGGGGGGGGGAGVNHLVLSEVFINMSGADTAEFVEIYNPTDSAVDLSSWSLQYLSGGASDLTSLVKKNFEAGDAIVSHGFFLVGMGAFSSTTIPDMTWSQTLNNTGATIFIVNDQIDITDTSDPNLIDRLGYGTGTTILPEAIAAALPGLDQSLERNAFSGGCVSAQGAGELLGNGCDTDVNSADFEIRPVPAPQNTGSASEP